MSRGQFGLGYQKGKADALAEAASRPPEIKIIEVEKKPTPPSVGQFFVDSFAQDFGSRIGNVIGNAIGEKIFGKRR
jgi:hypothetical protein